MYSYGPPHMAVQKLDDQHEHTFSNYVRIQDVVQKTCLRWRTIGKSGERGSGISVQPAWHDDDDDDFKISRINDVIGFYISNSSHNISRETFCDAFQIVRCEKQWHPYFIFKYLLFCTQINKRHLRKAGGFSRWNVFQQTTIKNHAQNIAVSMAFTILIPVNF